MTAAGIVLAGGKGSRMQSDVPKQYMELLGKPLLYYSLKAFE
ncbi:MAG: 2-C-methyl-D-erythritol 4-phosphate cytidylyltransferase, partial [Lachnospiraceae bacterium]|nr:2-C-methyl-D-erythritol 4-phosphate cytidylyltransferase [Lachnospiraceae bacterium]